MAGRPKQTPLQKAKSKASRAYWKWHELQNKMPGELLEDRIQYAESKKTMGRPPVKLAVQQDKSRKAWEGAIAEYRELEAVDGIEPVPEQEIIQYKKKDSAGRPRADQVDKIQKFIRRQDRLIDQLQNEIDGGATEPEYVRGRRPKTRQEKIEEYRSRIKDAEAEISELVSHMPEIDRTRHEINELRVKSRETNVYLKFIETEHGKSREAAIARREVVKGEITKLENQGVDRKAPELMALRTERRHISVFLNTKLDPETARVRQKDLEKQLQDLTDKLRYKLLGGVNAVPVYDQESSPVDEEQKERVRQEAFDRKYKEIEDRNERLRKQLEKLKENKELERQIREMGGDPDGLEQAG